MVKHGLLIVSMTAATRRGQRDSGTPAASIETEKSSLTNTA